MIIAITKGIISRKESKWLKRQIETAKKTDGVLVVDGTTVDLVILEPSGYVTIDKEKGAQR